MRASGYSRAASDWYVEPRSCINALLDVETFAGQSWDPSCGGGNIPLAMQARGLNCWGSDIADRGFGTTGLSFFDAEDRADSIVSNPPYGVIEDYIDRALSLTDCKVAILARLAFLEGQARRQKFTQWPLARVWVSSKRLSMPPGGTDVKAAGGTTAYAWFVFEHGHSGAPAIGWLP